MKRISTKIWGFIIALALVGALVPAVSGVKADSVAAATNYFKVGNNEFPTLQAAIDATNQSSSDKTITMIADVKDMMAAMSGVGVGILQGTEDVVLDLNGHTLAALNSSVLSIGENAKLTVKGAGQIGCLSYSLTGESVPNYPVIKNAGNVVIGEVGKNDATESPIIAGVNYVNGDYTIANEENGRLTVNSGTITGLAIETSALMGMVTSGVDLSLATPSETAGAITTSGKLAFNGGTVTHPIYLKITQNNEELIFNNGTFENIILVTTATTNQTIKEKIQINGGKFRQSNDELIYVPNSNGTPAPVAMADNATVREGYVWGQSGDYNVLHEHRVVAVPAKEATLTENGNIAYYTCAGCGKCYSDAAGNTEIAADSVVIPANIFVVSGSATIDDVVVDKVIDSKDEDEVFTLDLTVVDEDVTCARIPVAGLSKIIAAGEDPVLKIDYANGNVVAFDLNAMKAMVAKCGTDTTAYVSIDISEKKVDELNDAQKNALTGADVVKVVSGEVTCGTTPLNDFDGGAAVILFPYKLDNVDDYELVGHYVAEDGELEEVLCLYDDEEEYVYIGTEHFSDFAVTKVEDVVTGGGSSDYTDDTDGTTGSTGGTGANGGVNKQVAAATGDNTNMYIWVSLLVVSLGALATVIIYAKKKNIFK